MTDRGNLQSLLALAAKFANTFVPPNAKNQQNHRPPVQRSQSHIYSVMMICASKFLNFDP